MRETRFCRSRSREGRMEGRVRGNLHLYSLTAQAELALVGHYAGRMDYTSRRFRTH